MRAGLVILGFGLVLLWVVGLTQGATRWLTWAELTAALLSFAAVAAASRVGPAERGRLALGAPFTLAVALLILWISGLALGATAWLAWWTFAFGIGYALLGTGVGSTNIERPPETGPRPV